MIWVIRIKEYRIGIKGLGFGLIHAENRDKAYAKAYKVVKDIGYYKNYIEFKKDVKSLKEVKE